ncbi:Folliculin [Ascosphaera apis ARSEF 7405]|uniref:Folliculin n=1 Tax=Ascosphaera apis ARSEF 7405 TaxID=392613 RepID=A0A167ZHJ5_9EURO|nr:Folliculin [Ascosphaera apis ARSEF 7405]
MFTGGKRDGGEMSGYFDKLSLTHFCEVHGPTSILCSQLMPLNCPQCAEESADILFTPASPFLSHAECSPESRSVRKAQRDDRPLSSRSVRPPATSSGVELSTSPTTAPSPVVSEPPTLLTPPALSVPLPSIPAGQKLDAETCASCSLLVPESASRSKTDSSSSSSPPSSSNHHHKRNNAPSSSSSQAQDASESSQQSQSQRYRTQSPPANTDTTATATATTYPKRDSSPIFRSTEIVSSCDNEYHDKTHEHHRDIHHKRSGDRHSRKYSNSSYHSNTSDFSVFSASSATNAPSCHRHALSYISFRGPSDPEESRSLRQASVRTLSCELLPKGITSGPLSFGDAESGYTVAYIFRIPDPMARGKRRSYALMALAGKDSQRAFRACPLIWRVFERIANQIIKDAEKEANRLRGKENPGSTDTSEQCGMKSADGKGGQGFVVTTPSGGGATASGGGGGGGGGGGISGSEPTKITAATARNFDKPVTSFLTGRARTQTFHSANAGPPPASTYRRANLHSTTSPYGGDFARNAAGQIRARNLAEITGNHYIFAELHAQFVLLLKELRRIFPSARPQRSGSAYFPQTSIASYLPSSEELDAEAEDTATATVAEQDRRARDTTPCQSQSATGLTLTKVNTAGAGAGTGAGADAGNRDRTSTSPVSSSYSEGNSSPASATTSATTASHGHGHDQGFPTDSGSGPKRHSREQEHMPVSHHSHTSHHQQHQRNTHKRPSVDDGAPARQGGNPAASGKSNKSRLHEDAGQKQPQQQQQQQQQPQHRLSVPSAPGLGGAAKAIPITSMRRNVAT